MTIQTTIVSAFVANVNNNRNVTDYIKYGLKMMLTPIHKILFMDANIIIEIESQHLIPDEYTQYLHLIPTTIKDCYLSEYIPQITQFNICGNSEKDTLNYMIIMNNKLDFVKRAIEINVFNSSQFIWVDFGINHINKSLEDTEFSQQIVNLKNNVYNKVRIGSIWQSSQQLEEYYIIQENIYTKVAWIFAGGVFGGDVESLLQFEKVSREKCLQVIKEKGNIMWEVNIWYMVYLENKELFSLYNCSHNLSLITNYCKELNNLL
jgi:hypothetical protein